MLFFPDCSTVIRGAPRHVAGAPKFVASAPKFVAGAPKFVAGTPRFVAGAPRVAISAPSYSEGRQECPPRVWYSPEIDASKFTLHILSDTPGDFQWLKYILLMYPERLKFETNHKQTISDFRQHPIPRVHEVQIVMKAWIKNWQFLSIQVTVIVRQAYNPSHYIRLYPACRFNSRCTSIGRNCMLLMVFPLSDEASWRIHLILTRYYAQHLNVSHN